MSSLNGKAMAHFIMGFFYHEGRYLRAQRNAALPPLNSLPLFMFTPVNLFE